MQACRGMVLKTARKLARKSQAETSEYIHVGESTYRGWESGKYSADENALLKLEEYFGDFTLCTDYMEASSPIWRAKAKDTVETMALCKKMREVHLHLATLMPQISMLLGSGVSQLAT